MKIPCNRRISLALRPHRVQLRRVKGWRMPESTIFVARPTRWGNPIRLLSKPSDCVMSPEEERRRAVEGFRAHATNRARLDPAWLAPLRGKNLACYCRLDQMCHGDILLELANRPEL